MAIKKNCDVGSELYFLSFERWYCIMKCKSWFISIYALKWLREWQKAVFLTFFFLSFWLNDIALSTVYTPSNKNKMWNLNIAKQKLFLRKKRSFSFFASFLFTSFFFFDTAKKVSKAETADMSLRAFIDFSCLLLSGLWIQRNIEILKFQAHEDSCGGWIRKR